MATSSEPTPVELAAADLAYNQGLVDESKVALQAEVKKAAGLGVPVARLAAQAGVGRGTIYAWLGIVPAGTELLDA